MIIDHLCHYDHRYHDHRLLSLETSWSYLDSIWFLMVSILRKSKNDDDDDDGGGSGNDDYDGVPLMELMRTMTAYTLCTD